MNLLGRKEMSVLLVVAIAISFGGCREDLGVELPPDVQRTEIKVAEFTLPVTNVFFDSLRTDKEGVLIVGEYSDVTFGKITGKGFTEFQFKNGALPSTNFQWINRGDYSDSLSDYEFAGARIILDVNKVLTDDNFISQNIEMYSLTDSIFAEGIYLSNRSIGESPLIGQGNVTLNNLSDIDFDDDKVPVSITLEEAYSNFLYDRFEEGTLGRPFGFSIAATSSNGIMSFDVNSDTTELQLLIRGNIYDTLSKTIIKDTIFSAVNFRLSSSSHFSSILRDRSGSTFESVTNKTEVDFNPDYVYFNELAGIFPRIDLTPFLEFAESEEGVLINKGTLTIEDEAIGSLPSINVINYFFTSGEETVSINWPNALRYPQFFSTLLQTDSRYLTTSSTSPGTTFHQRTELTESPATTGYKGSNTIFWQYIYDNHVDDINGVPATRRPTIRQYLIGVDDIVMNNPDKLTLGRSLIKKEGVKLKIYYTKPRQ